jgi:hypothetical protein
MNAMRLLALLLLTTTLSAQGVSAQGVSPIEESYGPYPRPQRGGRQALAVGSSGILLAWSETLGGAPRIRIGLLDSRAQLISGIATLPVTAESAEAYAPAVAFNGESFLVAWVERYRGGEKIRSLAVDGSGVPVTSPKSYGFVGVGITDVTPLIVWDGAAWQVLEGSREGVQAAATNGSVRATARLAKTMLLRNCWLFRCVYYGNRWDVAWTAGTESGTERIGGDWSTGTTPVGMSNIAAAGDAFAVTWASSLGIGYLFTSSTRSNTVHAFVDDDVAPGLACDDERCLIAYGTFNGDVHAMVVETGDLHSPQLLTITATERKEHSPLVHSLGSGRFLVSYLSDQGAADQRINGRIVSFGPPRRRAMR